MNTPIPTATSAPLPIGPALQAWRRQHSLTQERAAAVLGIPLDRVREWEQGRRVPRAYVATLVREKMAKFRSEEGAR